ncbi:hypothetical protein AOQ84DRAFT_188699 [Glonium stellatum]|uniref:Uncharacterized protein n=1 Tax=Glonium stellatum TaxID=574774 RepID=A0A8E2F6G8_9PEZI|nr:hypothetical protein AOQ84DRAFT_188699 [Glonium stellatum]
MHDHTFSLPSSMQMQRDATQCFGAFHPFITSNAPSFPFTCSPFNLSTPTSAPAPTPLPLPHPNAFCFAHDTRKTAPILQHRCKNAHKKKIRRTKCVPFLPKPKKTPNSKLRCPPAPPVKLA